MTVTLDPPNDPLSAMTLRDALEYVPFVCACYGCPVYRMRCGPGSCEHYWVQRSNLIRAAHIVARLLADEAGLRFHETFCADLGHPGTSPVVATVETTWNIHAPTEETP